jgi:hypothetical protein
MIKLFNWNDLFHLLSLDPYYLLDIRRWFFLHRWGQPKYEPLALLHTYFLRQYIFRVFLYKFAISHIDNGTASIQRLFQNVLSECHRHSFEINIYRFSIHSAKVEKINFNAKKLVR